MSGCGHGSWPCLPAIASATAGLLGPFMGLCPALAGFSPAILWRGDRPPPSLSLFFSLSAPLKAGRRVKRKKHQAVLVRLRTGAKSPGLHAASAAPRRLKPPPNDYGKGGFGVGMESGRMLTQRREEKRSGGPEGRRAEGFFSPRPCRPRLNVQAYYRRLRPRMRPRPPRAMRAIVAGSGVADSKPVP